MVKNNIILLCGKSGSGKTTLAEMLWKAYGLTSLESYTTRPKRAEDEKGHTFISEEEFNNLTEICAYGEFDGYKYCATKEQVNKSDIYIIDAQGIDYFKKHYFGKKKPVVVYIKASPIRRFLRLIKRDGIRRGFKRWINDIPHFIGIKKMADYIVLNNTEKDMPYRKIFAIYNGAIKQRV